MHLVDLKYRENIRSCTAVDRRCESSRRSRAFAVVLECVPEKLARKVTEAIHIPTIGIGAGAGCDGQILVYADMLSMFSDFSPKFVRSFANVGEIMSQAFKDYDAAVKDSSFPAQEHTFKIDEEVLDKLY